MITVIETPIFQRMAALIWDDAEREAFISWIAANPVAGNVIPGVVPLRKVRWSRPGMGKRGGVRVLYFNRESDGVVVLVAAYAKSKFDNLPLAVMRAWKDAFDE